MPWSLVPLLSLRKGHSAWRTSGQSTFPGLSMSVGGASSALSGGALIRSVIGVDSVIGVATVSISLGSPQSQLPSHLQLNHLTSQLPTAINRRMMYSLCSRRRMNLHQRSARAAERIPTVRLACNIRGMSEATVVHVRSHG